MIVDAIRRGQACGAVRTDLSEDLLIDLTLAVDETLDRWLARHIDSMSREEGLAAIARYAETLRRLLEPREEKKP